MGTAVSAGEPEWGLEVLGDDVAGLEGGDEPVDLVLHVGLHQVLEVAHERLGAAIELLVEALDDVLLEHAGPAPLAVRAAEGDLPVLGARLLPVHRVHELGLARATHVQVLGRLGGRAGGVADVTEVDDLDGLAGGQDDAADVGVVLGLAAHVLAPDRNLIGHPALGLYASADRVENWRVATQGDPLDGIPQYICAYAEHWTSRAGDPPADRPHHLRPEAASRPRPAARLGDARVQGLDHRQGQGRRRPGRGRDAARAASDARRARPDRRRARSRHRRGAPGGPARLAHGLLRAQRARHGRRPAGWPRGAPQPHRSPRRAADAADLLHRRVRHLLLVLLLAEPLAARDDQQAAAVHAEPRRQDALEGSARGSRTVPDPQW